MLSTKMTTQLIRSFSFQNLKLHLLHFLKYKIGDGNFREKKYSKYALQLLELL